MNREEVLKQLRESKVTLYAIGLLEDNDQRGGLFSDSPSQKAKKILKQFAEVTGGVSYFPKSIDEVDDLCKQIAHDLRNRYTLGYTPTNRNLDGSWRELRVVVNPPKAIGSRMSPPRHKQGYLAPKPNPSQQN